MLQKLMQEIEKKEKRITNLQDDIYDLQAYKSFLIGKIKKLELVLEEKDLIICKLSTKLCAAQRKLEKIEHYCESMERG